MSDRLSDAELALSRLRDFCAQHKWDGEPALSALRPLLDEVREARKVESVTRIDVEFGQMRKRIAELEDARDFWKERALESERRSGAVAAENSTVEHHRKRAKMFADRIDAREAQLAEMRREIAALESVPRNGYDHDDLVADERLDDVLEIIDRYAIPTTPPEAEEDRQ